MGNKWELDGKDLYERTGIYFGELITPLRCANKDKIEKVELMSKNTLENLLKNICLRNSEFAKPYEEAKISISRFSPDLVKIGQTFVQEEKLIDILLLQDLFDKYYPIVNISKMPPLIVYFKKNNKKAVSFYIPPIVEVHNNNLILLDGIHRSYLTKGIGSTLMYIIIENVKYRLPFTAEDWNKIKIVKDKPRFKERYFRLKEEYFRDLKYVGIDG